MGGPYSVLGKIIGNSRDGPPWAAARTALKLNFRKFEETGIRRCGVWADVVIGPYRCVVRNISEIRYRGRLSWRPDFFCAEV